ncbi:LAFE_0D11760g1_1 [Lachancea fermentati]|uniref:LAFE_0D11760g1_1 n=1 Tax=Lachancea fermentati TaxID=4955 RepID=A0A1G4MBY4_LACFM|nr:LAFE_0D11760g1_1 [Lachancea fermentati]
MEGTTTAASGNFDEWLFPENNARMGSFGEYDGAKPLEGNGWDLDATRNSVVSSTSSSSAGSPLDQFTSLFDANAMLTQGSDSETLFTASNTVSLSNSPTIVKQEDVEAKFMPGLDQFPLAIDIPPAASAGKDAASAASAPSASRAVADDAASESQAQAARKKRAPRKRLTAHQKQAHNKIEKRYRININTKIAKLQQIIPWVASEETAFEVGESLRPKPASAAALEGAAAAAPKLNKSMILEKAVDYILYLQNNERLYELEVQRLKKELESLRSTSGSAASSAASSSSSSN